MKKNIKIFIIVALVAIVGFIFILNSEEQHEILPDATVKSYMDQIKYSAEIYRTNQSTVSNIYGSYAGFFNEGGDYTELTAKIKSNGAAVFATSTDSAYCVRSDLMIKGEIDKKNDWCVDSTGYSGPVSSTQCTEADITCQ